MAEVESQATADTIGKKKAESAEQRAALAQFGPADLEAVKQFLDELSKPGTAAQGSESVTVSAARARAFFKVGAG